MKPRTMKKIFYTLTAAAICLTACQKEITENWLDEPVFPEGSLVEATFTVSIPISEKVTTKGDHDMGETPILNNLYIAIFGESGGMLQQLVPATLVDYFDEDSPAGYNNKAEYKAMLPLYDDECHLHFIGNYNGDPTDLAFEYEKDFMDNLSMKIETQNIVQDGHNYTTIKDAPGSYWQKVILKDGIKGKTVDGKLVLSDETKAKLSPIPLVRNYAKITVISAAPTLFNVLSYALVNVPYQGSVAPYCAADNQGFDNIYMSIGKYCDGTYNVTDATASNFRVFSDDILESGYIGYMPPQGDLIFTGNPGEGSAVSPDADDNGLYMYERTVPATAGEQTGVIVHILWADDLSLENQQKYGVKPGDDYYYKLEVLNEDGEYMPICRNVHYKISLTSITGAGAASFDTAFSGPFFGNVSSSIETATLTTINDNLHQIVVNRMDYTSVDGGDEVSIYVQFYPSKGNSGFELSTNTANYSAGTDNILKVDGYEQAIKSVSAIDLVAEGAAGNPFETGACMKVVVKLEDKPETGTLRGKLRVQGVLDNGVGSLYRDIVFTVMNKQDFTDESKIEATSTGIKVTIGLPTDLPYSLFPLYVNIEAQNNNLTTTSALLPVGYGPSTFGTGKNSFWFTRTIEYKKYVDTSTGEYVYTTEFECDFTRTDTEAVVVKLTDQKGYFNEKILTL